MEILKKLVFEISKNPPKTARELDKINRLFLRTHKKEIAKIPRKKDLLKVYHKLLKQNKLKQDKQLEMMLVKRAVRTLSGVTIVTVLTKPFSCPGQCIYCPDEKRMPKSYISDEPAAARALKLGFDPFLQVTKRIQALQDNGHPTDKIELIVKGGSWNAYPLKYQYWFILRCFQACNNIRNKVVPEQKDLDKIKQLLKKVQTRNESAKHRIIGLTLETRPDMVNNKTVEIMRELGCTRMEIGVQTIDEKILKLIKRGHNVEAVKTATRLLRDYGFKVDYHLMPQLPSSTPAKDLKMMKEIFSNPAYRPDMIKIYPCTVIANTKLSQWLKQGKYKPYSNKKLIEILKKLKISLPYYVRISRLIRDIPSPHIEAGNKLTNLRQIIQAEIKADGKKCNCLRCREIGHNQNFINQSPPKLFIDEYKTVGGKEYFISYEDKNRQVVFGFCRLRICEKNSTGPFPAYIRELHTYGQLVQIGQKENNATQHQGWGKKLVQTAENICTKQKIPDLAVISGVGVRSYYHKLGYQLDQGYMTKKLK